jgi:hypothetical protein
MFMERRKDGKWYDPLWRQGKRYHRTTETYAAWCRGQWAAEHPDGHRNRRNPYPSGVRSIEFERGLAAGHHNDDPY